MRSKFLLVPATALVLIACGGGGGGGSNPATSGIAVDGYLNGATVLCDADGTGFTSASNVTTTTGATGNFTFAQGCNSPLIARGGKSIDTGLDFVGLLKAPKGATVVSPLTTLIAAGVTESALSAALGLTGTDFGPTGTDFLHTDPADGNHLSLLQKTLVVQQLMQKTTELIVGIAGTGAAVGPIYTEVAKAFASQLAGGNATLGGTLNAADTSRLVNAAIVGVIASAATTDSGVAPAVATALTSAGGANVLTSLAKDAMTLQAQAIMGAAADQITAVTRNQQADTTITSTAKAQLAPATNYLYLANDSISFNDGYLPVTYTLAQFQSLPGIAVTRSLSNLAAIDFTLANTSDFSVAAGQTLNAAVSINDVASNGGKLLIKLYIGAVSVSQSGNAVTLSVPDWTNTAMYATLDGSEVMCKLSSPNCSPGNVSMQTTLNTSGSVASAITIGNLINSAINNISANTKLAGSYKITFAVDGLALRQADGAALPLCSKDDGTGLQPCKVDVPSATGNKSVTGAGLEGYITF